MRTEILKKGKVVVSAVLGVLVGFLLYYLVQVLIA